jgi:hypothetical protein
VGAAAEEELEDDELGEDTTAGDPDEELNEELETELDEDHTKDEEDEEAMTVEELLDEMARLEELDEELENSADEEEGVGLGRPNPYTF